MPQNSSEAQMPAADQKKKKPSTLTSAASGGLSGALISACVQPLDVLRTRMQADAGRGLFRSTIQTFQTVVAEGGVRSLWAGTAPTVIRLSLGAGIHFTLLENIKVTFNRTFGNTTDTLPPLQAAAAGGLSRALAAVTLCPVTVVKTRMEYRGPGAVHYKGVADALATIARTEGPRGLFRGLAPTVLTNAPFSALYYMFYTQIKQALAGEGRPQVLVNFTSGFVAAVGATVLTQPTDFARTRVQLGMTAASSGSLDLLAQSVRQHGGKALMSGVLPRVLKRTAQTALVWTLYEELVPALTAAAALVAATRSGTAVQGSSSSSGGGEPKR